MQITRLIKNLQDIKKSFKQVLKCIRSVSDAPQKSSEVKERYASRKREDCRFSLPVGTAKGTESKQWRTLKCEQNIFIVRAKEQIQIYFENLTTCIPSTMRQITKIS